MARYQSKADVINGIRKAAERKQRIPYPSENKALRDAARRYFGSWAAGVRAAGFAYRDIKHCRSLSKIDKELLNSKCEPLKKSVESTIPEKCQKCYWRAGAICPFVECVKDREESKC